MAFGITDDGRPVDWHGHEMEPIGRGAYPYDCAAKDKYPDDMVYQCPTCKAWTHAPFEVIPRNVAWV